MDVLQLIDAFDPDYFGGAARVFSETCRVLVGDGHGVRAICRMPSGKIGPSDISDFSTYDDIAGGTLKKISYYRHSVRRLFLDCVAERHPDVIVLHSSSAAFGTLDLLLDSDIPVVYYFHSPWSLEHDFNMGLSNMSPINPARFFGKLGSWIRKSHEGRYLSASNGIITLSEYMVRKMISSHEQIIEGKPRHVIPGGVDQGIFRPTSSKEDKYAIRARFSLDSDAFVVISSRRMIPRTGLDLLIRAFAMLEKDTLPGEKRKEPARNKRTLVLTGDGASMDDLKSLAIDLGVDDGVRFTGYVSESDLADYYRCSDLFVMPTRDLEGFGLSTVEAMASGLPVVGTDVGGTTEILSRISRNLLIAEPTAEAISAKISEFIVMDDPGEWSRRSLTAVAERHTWRVHVDAFLNFAERLLNAKKTR